MSGVNRPGSSNSSPTRNDPKEGMRTKNEEALTEFVAKWLNEIGSGGADSDVPEPKLERRVSQCDPMDTSLNAKVPTGPVTRSQRPKGKKPVSEEPKKAKLCGRRTRPDSTFVDPQEHERIKRAKIRKGVSPPVGDFWSNEEYFRSLLELKEDPNIMLQQPQWNQGPPKERSLMELFYTSRLVESFKSEQETPTTTLYGTQHKLPPGVFSDLIKLMHEFLACFQTAENREENINNIFDKLHALSCDDLTESVQLELVCLKAWCLLENGKFQEAKKLLDTEGDKINTSPFALFVKGRLNECRHLNTVAANCFRQALELIEIRKALPKGTFSRAQSILLHEQLEKLVRRSLSKKTQNTGSLWKVPSSENALLPELRALALFITSSTKKTNEEVTEAIKKLEWIIIKYPQSQLAQKLYVELLMEEKSNDASAISTCLDFLEKLMRMEPEEVGHKLNYMALIHKVQLARHHVGTHREGSLRANIKVLAQKVLRLYPASVVALRLLSMQYRFDGDYNTARGMIDFAFISLLRGCVKLFSASSGKAKKEIGLALHEIPYSLNKDLEKRFEKSATDSNYPICFLEESEKQDIFVYGNILHLIQKGESVDLLMKFFESLVSNLHSESRLNFSRWVAFILSDKAFINLKNLERLLEIKKKLEKPQECLTVQTKQRDLSKSVNIDEMKEEIGRLFRTALAIYETHPAAHLGLGELCRLFGDIEAQKKHLLTSYKIQPTYAVLERLRNLGLIELDEFTQLDDVSKQLANEMENLRLSQ